MDLQTVGVLIIIGLLAGILSGFVGVGGGIIMVPAMIWLLGYDQHQAQGTSLAVLMFPVVLLAVRNYWKQGMIDWKIVIVIAVAFVAGGYFGSKGALALPADTVKRVFGVIMLFVAIKLILGR
ncbi:MAG: sulfite exporter TauE/SafE family protein [Flavobacteriales bacterium]|nr:sulfite exporter TauE/SafE family protein [Flavobacteriales bacterium]MCC6938463.1 sulfite exporter TauE/SafE family protein [Flavobacteriales bacterium]